MPENPYYEIELIKSGEVVGFLVLSVNLIGNSIVFELAPPPLKQIYGKRYEKISVPIKWRCEYPKKNQTLLTAYLDVTKKSSRQIKSLLETYGN